MSSSALRISGPPLLIQQVSSALDLQKKQFCSVVCTGIPKVDSLIGGLPKGALSEIYGTRSSGRTNLLFSILAEATARGEVCAVVDMDNAFDPQSAAAIGVLLPQLLWVRCGHKVEHTLKVADLLLHAGGFGMVVMDLGDVPPATVRRIPLSCWYRFRRAVENTPSVFLVLEQEPYAKSCASLSLEMRQDRIAWSGMPHCSRLLRGMSLQTAPRKPVVLSGGNVSFEALALG